MKDGENSGTLDSTQSYSIDIEKDTKNHKSLVERVASDEGIEDGPHEADVRNGRLSTSRKSTYILYITLPSFSFSLII